MKNPKKIKNKIGKSKESSSTPLVNIFEVNFDGALPSTVMAKTDITKDNLQNLNLGMLLQNMVDELQKHTHTPTTFTNEIEQFLSQAYLVTIYKNGEEDEIGSKTGQPQVDASSKVHEQCLSHQGLELLAALATSKKLEPENGLVSIATVAQTKAKPN